MGHMVEGMTVAEKQQAYCWRDLIEPGWREREAERIAKFLAAVPVYQPGRRITAPESTRSADASNSGALIDTTRPPA